MSEIETLKAEADNGDVNSQIKLALQYYEEAGKLLQKAVNANSPQARYYYGLAQLVGLGVPENHFSAVADFLMSAEEKYARAYYNLGLCYEIGLGTPQNHKIAYKMYKKGEEEGNDAMCLYRLGECYDKGIGTERDESKALTSFIKASSQGSIWAHNKVGSCYLKVNNLDDLKRAFSHFKMAADGGNPAGYYNLAWCYAQGLGLPENSSNNGQNNPTKAFENYQIAANMHYVPAICNLAYCYAKGFGVQRNESRALELYIQAANCHYPDAMYNVGLCYENGTGCVRDLEEAKSWYRNAIFLNNHSNAESKLRALEGDKKSPKPDKKKKLKDKEKDSPGKVRTPTKGKLKVEKTEKEKDKSEKKAKKDKKTDLAASGRTSSVGTLKSSTTRTTVSPPVRPTTSPPGSINGSSGNSSSGNNSLRTSTSSASISSSSTSTSSSSVEFGSNTQIPAGTPISASPPAAAPVTNSLPSYTAPTSKFGIPLPSMRQAQSTPQSSPPPVHNPVQSAVPSNAILFGPKGRISLPSQMHSQTTPTQSLGTTETATTVDDDSDDKNLSDSLPSKNSTGDDLILVNTEDGFVFSDPDIKDDSPDVSNDKGDTSDENTSDDTSPRPPSKAELKSTCPAIPETNDKRNSLQLLSPSTPAIPLPGKKPILELLKELNLTTYSDSFTKYGIETAEDLRLVTEEDWQKLNVKPLHKKKLLGFCN